MKNKFTTILEKIVKSTGCQSGYILKSDSMGNEIITSLGEIGGDRKSFKEFNNSISTKFPNQSELLRSKHFLFLKKEYHYGDLLKEEFFTQPSAKHFLVLFSSKKLQNIKVLRAKIVKLLNELKTTSEKKEKAEATYLSLSSLDAPILVINDKMEILFANDLLCQLLNVNKKELTIDFFNSAKFFDTNNTELNFKDLPLIKSVRERKTILNFTVKYVDNGKEKTFSINSFFEKTDPPKSISLFTEVLISNELDPIYREVLSTLPTVLFSTNADGSEYYFITDAVRNLFGYSPQEIYENKFLILRSIDEEHFQKFRTFIEKLKTGEVASVEYKMKDRFGKEHWIRHSGFPIIRNGIVVRVVGMINEITEDKVVQLKLISSEERFRMLIDTADDLIFILNGFGYFSLVNKNGATALGYIPEEMIGKHFLEFIDKEDESKIAEAFSKILSTNEVTTFEAVFLDRFDKGVTFEIHAKPMYSEGEVSGMISIGRNITRRKLDEQKIRDLNAKLVEANRIISIERERARHKINVLEELNKLKGEFISNISHELRTPLASIVGFAETILSDPDLPKETLKEFNEIILSEGKRLAKLINDVLDFSKLESGEDELHKENIDLNLVLDEVLNIFSKQIKDKELYVSKEIPAEEIRITADRARIAQVFYNLLSNSIKFTSKGGRISILFNDYGKEIEFAFSDTGIGIPEKDLPKLFQKFSKIARPGAPLIGAGFGLATVKQIVELHKGIVRVKSEENKGTTFFIRLPKN